MPCSTIWHAVLNISTCPTHHDLVQLDSSLQLRHVVEDLPAYYRSNPPENVCPIMQIVRLPPGTMS